MTKQSKITAAHDMPVIEYLALAELTLSDLNPRKDVSEEGIVLLADSLVTCGLSEQGDWVLHSVYDARTCENCEESTNLLEIDEETELEIGFYGMIKDSDGARLVEDHEVPDFFDVVVRTTALTSGDILTLFEFEDRSRKDANASLAGLTVLFPKAPIDWHLGKEDGLIPSGGTIYR